MDLDPKDIIAHDETPLYVGYNFHHFVTCRPEERYLDENLQPKIRKGKAQQLWGAIWIGGRSQLVRFDCSESTGKRGGVTSAIYIEQVLKKHLIPEVKRHRRAKKNTCILEDNSGVHNADASVDAGNSAGFGYLPHPPYSPCLNPIENVWAELKRRLDACHPRPTTDSEAWANAQRCWLEIEQSFIDKCLESFPRRLQAVIDNEGGAIPY